MPGRDPSNSCIRRDCYGSSTACLLLAECERRAPAAAAFTAADTASRPSCRSTSLALVPPAPQREGRREELLAGPLLYGLVHTVLTVIYWRTSPAAIVGLAATCGGDGVADIAGRRYGHLLGPLPHNKKKVGGGICGVWEDLGWE